MKEFNQTKETPTREALTTIKKEDIGVVTETEEEETLEQLLEELKVLNNFESIFQNLQIIKTLLNENNLSIHL